MIKYCLEHWDANKDKLKKRFEEEIGWNSCSYIDVVKAVVETILNTPIKEYECEPWDAEHITEVDNGSYQGTLLYLIPLETYEPTENEYLITWVGYGSCPGCDTLLAIQDYGENKLTAMQVSDFMELAKDLVTNMRKPYNTGWRYSPDFDEVEF